MSSQKELQEAMDSLVRREGERGRGRGREGERERERGEGEGEGERERLVKITCKALMRLK